MILVDIYVPYMDREYDFKVDQNAAVSAVTEELAEMIARKERCVTAEGGGFSLCSREFQKVLPGNRTLAECGIRTGSRLILV